MLEVLEVLRSVEVNVADSWVMSNKTGIGHGEARLYIGSSKKNWKEFFENFEIPFIVRKEDLKNYLLEAEFEYKYPEQNYLKKDKLASLWNSYKAKLDQMDDITYLYFNEAQGEKDKDRFYIRSNDTMYKFLRSILLPFVSALILTKAKMVNVGTVIIIRPYMKEFSKVYHPFQIDKKIEEIEKKITDKVYKRQLILARTGQGDFRSKLLKREKCCLLSEINMLSLIEAAHIKPWSLCSFDEMYDSYNGLLLLPTYHKMFDLGLFTISEDSTILISDLLDVVFLERLHIFPNQRIRKLNVKVQKYLEYHRENIFRTE